MAAAAPGPVLPRAFVRALVGADAADQARFTDQVLGALAKISPSLTPTLFAHPYADAIADGVASLGTLVGLLQKAKDDDTRAAIVDAMAEVFIRENASGTAVRALYELIGTSKSERVVTLAARALAVAGEPAFLEQQRQFLASDSPSQLRLSAQILGFGRYRPAVPRLLELLRDDQRSLWDVLIWALGEIGDEAALPKLHRLLHAHLAVGDVIEALGKIGSATSAVRLLPVLIEGATEHRERAAQAMGLIARKNDGRLLDDALEQSVRLALERMIDQDDSRLARFHAVVAYSLLGGSLPPKRVLAALGAELAGEELDALSRVMLKKGAPPKAKVAPPAKAPRAAPAKSAPAKTGAPKKPSPKGK